MTNATSRLVNYFVKHLEITFVMIESYYFSILPPPPPKPPHEGDIIGMTLGPINDSGPENCQNICGSEAVRPTLKDFHGALLQRLIFPLLAEPDPLSFLLSSSQLYVLLFICSFLLYLYFIFHPTGLRLNISFHLSFSFSISYPFPLLLLHFPLYLPQLLFLSVFFYL